MHWGPFIGQLKTTVDKSTFLVEKVVGEDAEIVTPVNAARSRTNPNVACHLKKKLKTSQNVVFANVPRTSTDRFFFLTSNTDVKQIINLSQNQGISY
jgi:hypothetical protein